MYITEIGLEGLLYSKLPMINKAKLGIDVVRLISVKYIFL